MKVEISKIKVNDRIRKDLGNLQELADDIRENGLINPPVVTPDDHVLIAGQRRLEAMKLLGYKETEVRLMAVNNAEHQLNLEISDNEITKNLSKEEVMEYTRRLSEIKRQKEQEHRVSAQNNKNPLGFDDWGEDQMMKNKAYQALKKQTEALEKKIKQEQKKRKHAKTLSELNKKYINQLNELKDMMDFLSKPHSDIDWKIFNLKQTQNKHNKIINKLKKENNVLGSPVHSKRKNEFRKCATRRVISVLGNNIASPEYLLFSSFLYKKIYRDVEEEFDVGGWTDISMDDFEQPNSLYEYAKFFLEFWRPSKSYIDNCLRQLKEKRSNNLLSAEKCIALTIFLNKTNNGELIWFCSSEKE